MQIEQWFQFVQQRERLITLQAATCDRNHVLAFFWSAAEVLTLPVYFANAGYRQLQRVTSEQGQIKLQPTEAPYESLSGIISSQTPGIFVLQGLLQDLANPTTAVELMNAHFELRQSPAEQFIVLLDDGFDIPLNLHVLLPKLEYSFPKRAEVQQQVAEICQQQLGITDTNGQRAIVQSCIGLPRGEIDQVLRRTIAQTGDLDEIAQQVLNYKRDKLRGRGINLLPKPDVSVAAGLEKLDETLEKIRLLLQPEAEQRNLHVPRAMLLWGIPGVGKSLAAKLAAQRIGATLVACDWNGLVGSSVRESMDNLNYLLRFVGEIGVSILFFDEFEKAYSGWRSSAESGILTKLAGRLLSWMQDHTEPVVMIATINHLDMLPAEILRRFDYKHFFGMPHAGALYEVFNVHLPKYFRYEFSEMQWRVLLREFRGCTPDEVGKAVAQVAHNLYFRDMRSGTFSSDLPWVSVEDLVAERQNFTPASAQSDISDQIAGILRKAKDAKPVSGKDTSVFATPPQKLLGLSDADQTPAATQERPFYSPLIHRDLTLEEI